MTAGVENYSTHTFIPQNSLQQSSFASDMNPTLALGWLMITSHTPKYRPGRLFVQLQKMQDGLG